MTEAAHTGGRPGSEARRPGEIPARGWLQAANRVRTDIGRHNVSLVAAGLALYALLAVFPGLAAVLSVYGMLASPEQVANQVQALSQALPQQAAEILRQQLAGLASEQSGALGAGAAGGFLLALWSARKGMAALMTATNIAYAEDEERGFIKLIAVSLGFTLAAVVAFVVFLLIVVALPVAMHLLGFEAGVQVVTAVLRWALLWVLVVLGLGVLYRYGPDRPKPRWRWVSPGSAIAATLWMAASVGFALYVRNFGSYNETYGALGGVVVLLMWFYLSGFIVVLGAEINAHLERQPAAEEP